MNDPFAPFTKPTPQASWLRTQARTLRRASIRRRRDGASGEDVKLWNGRLNWREFWHGRTALESFPRTVQVGTNWTCNLKCSFCRLTMPWTQDELKKLPGRALQISDHVEAVIERLLPHAEMMTLTPLGEPLMWRGFKDFLEIHRRLGCRNLAFTTNAQLMRDEMAERIVRSEVSQIFISCDSNDPEIYAGMRVGGDLKSLEEGAGRLVAWKKKLGVPWPEITLCATFMRRNIPQLPSMVRWAQALGVDELNIQLMEIENPAHESEFLGRHPDLTRRMVTEALTVGREIGFRVRPHLAVRNLISASAEGHDVVSHEFGGAAPNMPDKYKQDIEAINAGTETYGNLEGEAPAELQSPESGSAGELAGLDSMLDMRGKTLVEKCHYPWYNMMIDTDGDVRACCWVGSSWGNLDHEDFDAVWNGARAVGMRKSFLADNIPEGCLKKHCRVDL